MSSSVSGDDRALLEVFLSLLDAKMEVAWIVEDGRNLVHSLLDARPDVIVADLSTPGLDGIEIARELKSAIPDVKIILLSHRFEPAFASEALRAGASALVLKTSGACDVGRIIQEVLSGRVYETPITG